MKSYAALILAAGKSTRMKSDRSKLLHEVAGVPIISRVGDLVARLGCDPAVLVVSHQKDMILDAFGAKFSGALMVDQGVPKGTGHAVMKGMEALDGFAGEVIILAGDVPLLSFETVERFKKVHEESGALLTVMTMEPGNPHGYGRVIRGEHGPERIIEQKDLPPELSHLTECNGGIYIVNGPWLARVIGTIDNNNSQGEFYLTDLLELVPPGGVTASMLVPEQELLGVNTRAHLAQAEAIAQGRIARQLMEEGVTILSPGEVTIHEGVRVGRDTVILRGVALRGATSIGEGCLIDQGCVITDAHIGDGVVIKPYSVIEASRVEETAQVGPFSHLRPHSHLMRGAKVGNFVECKKSTLHEGVKANHLTYLGDAEVGAGTNIGAGTITCNYDGVNKFKTTIGERVFIGSDSQLIAPLEIGDDAYVGTGTTVRSDVPAGSLVVNPKSERVIEQWVPPKGRS